jgi:cytochrome P450
MLSIWLSKPSGRVSNMVEDTRIVALHVLSAAGFGVSHDFSGGARLPTKGHTLSHKDALMTLLNNLKTMIVLCQMRWLEAFKPILSNRLCSIFVAIREFGQYMDEMLDNERQIIAKSQGASKPNLISVLIRTSDEAKAEGLSSSNVRLTDEEIKGNLFIFNLAGHDTTANALAYSTALLAAYPDIQDWVVEEVDRVLSEEEKKGGPLVYETVFPKLPRVLAVMVYSSFAFP